VTLQKAKEKRGEQKTTRKGGKEEERLLTEKNRINVSVNA